MCKDNTKCKDPTCPDWHNCTKNIGSGSAGCPRLVLGSPSNNTKPGQSARAQQCDVCREVSRKFSVKHRASRTKEEKQQVAASRKRPRDGEPIGTADPVQRLEAEWASLAPMIDTHPDWIMLRNANSDWRVIDFEFASAPSDLVEGSTVFFQICVIGYKSGEIFIDELVNFTPSDYPGNHLEYLKSVLPKNVDRAMESLRRVHKLEKGNESELADRIRQCKPTAKIIEDLAAVARDLNATGGGFVAHGFSPELPMIDALEKQFGPDKFPVSGKLNSLAILSSIANHTRGKYLKAGDSSTKVPCSLGGAYSAITGTELPNAHTAYGDCLGTNFVLKEIQRCRQQCEANSR
jgi:hypothetical protein